MKCAIMQPTYIPWAGYFNLIASVDVFVFLDDVQFSKGSWQQRNRIAVGGKELFLTVPVLKSGKSSQLINEVKTDLRNPWGKKHLATLRQAYSKHPFGETMIQAVENTLTEPSHLLANTSIEIIQRIAQNLNLRAQFIRSSQLKADGKKSAHVIELCRELNADIYLSPVGSKDYIEEEGLFTKSSIKLIYQNFELKEYPQKKSDSFLSHLSILDMIANIGFEESKKYVFD